MLRKKQIIINLALTAAMLVTGCALSNSAPLGPILTGSTSVKAVSYTVKQLPRFVESGLDPYDRTPLGNRTPLILVHGIAGQDDHLFNWANFLNFVDKEPEFKQKYKIYLYHYDSSRSVPDISDSFQQTLKNFIQVLNGHSVKIVAYSEGGLITRNAMQDPYLDGHTQEVITIATPFHGSPLANPEWVREQVKTESIFSVIRMTQKLAYKITGKLYPTFKQDFHWDNFDGAIPVKQYVQNNGPMASKDYALAHKAHFITYGSYFGLDVNSDFLVQQLGLNQAPPKERLQIANIFKRNGMFSLVRNNIARLPIVGFGNLNNSAGAVTTNVKEANTTEASATTEIKPATVVAVPAVALPLVHETSDGAFELSTPPDTIRIHVSATQESKSIKKMVPPEELKPIRNGPSLSMMVYNDGISPISSTLWLGRYTNTLIGVSQPTEKLWATLRSLKGNRNTRLFAGIDHRNWMDGDTRTGNNIVQDLLNPDQKARTVFEWLMFDLMT